MDSTKVDSRRTSSALQLAQVAAGKWELVQVELQGRYSLERMRAFFAYSFESRWHHILFWCIVTPIPSLAISILLDIAPLAQPSAGRDANYVFWIRLAAFTVIINFWVLMQLGYLTPALGMKPWHAFSTSCIVSVTCTAASYILADLISMPVPFLMLIGCPSFLIPSSVMIAFYFGRKLLNDAALLASFHRAGASSGLQLLLMFIIPAFIYGFNSISPKYQTPYLILLPVIKLVAKNIMSRIIDSNDDMKPVEIIFNIDCFNAIYVSLAMQRATTISTSLIIILIDVFQGCVSVYDVYLGFQPLNQFMSKLPAGHPLHRKNFLEVAIALDQEVELLSRKNQTDNATLPGPMVQTKSVKLPNVRIGVRASTKNSVAPIQTAKENAYPDVSMKQNLFSSESRAAFLHATRKLLFTSEFVILVEYTEVIMPVFYSLVIAASYHLPNRAFYSTISNIGEHELWHMVASVLMYAALELASLVAMNVVLGWITGVSPIRQVGFVLDDQRELVQSKLLSWVFYAVQNSLEHFGADFSFQFKWMRSD